MKKVVKKYLVVSILLSVWMVISIPCLVISAVNHMYWLMAIFIASVGILFYALPFLWIYYGKLNRMNSASNAILRGDVKTISEFMEYYGYSRKQSLDMVRSMLSKGYLIGFKLDGERIVKVTNTVTKLCPYCGAKEIELKLDQSCMCKYCGGMFKL